MTDTPLGVDQPQRHGDTETSQGINAETQRRRDHRNVATTKTRRHEVGTKTSQGQTTEASQGETASQRDSFPKGYSTQRREGAKSQRTEPESSAVDGRPIGRTATARSRGISARKDDRQTPAFVESTFLHLRSRLRRARPASVASGTQTFPPLSYF